MRAGFRQIAEAVENESAHGIEAFFLKMKAQLREIIEPRATADDHAAFAEMLDVKCWIAHRHGVTNDFLDDVIKRDDAFGAAEFIHNHGHALAVLEKTAQQIERFHRLRHE